MRRVRGLRVSGTSGAGKPLLGSSRARRIWHRAGVAVGAAMVAAVSGARLLPHLRARSGMEFHRLGDTCRRHRHGDHGRLLHHVNPIQLEPIQLERPVDQSRFGQLQGDRPLVERLRLERALVERALVERLCLERLCLERRGVELTAAVRSPGSGPRS